MDIASILGAGNAATTQATERNDDLGRDEFLQMLITQLENQDPLNPQDATEFTAQLAQFSSLDQLFSMRTAIEELSKVQGSTNALSVASLIGRRVAVESAQVEIPAAGQPLPQFLLESANNTEILGADLRDSSGRLVGQLTPRTLPSGRVALDWADLGGAPPPGIYRLNVTAAGGAAQPTVLVDASVTGATFADGTATLLLGSLPVSIDQLREVRQ
jgi:flagellar basal-body rod modification protein FlgD